MEIELKRTMNDGKIVSLKGYKCDCGRIYGLTNDLNYLKIQEISYVRCMLSHKGIDSAWTKKQFGGYTDLEIKKIAKDKLDYDLKLTFEKPKSNEPRCECGHLKRYHHSFHMFSVCQYGDCHCGKFRAENVNITSQEVKII